MRKPCLENIGNLPCLLYNMEIFTYHCVFFDPTVVINCDWSCGGRLSFTTLHLLSYSASDSGFYSLESLLPPHLPATQAAGIWRYGTALTCPQELPVDIYLQFIYFFKMFFLFLNSCMIWQWVLKMSKYISTLIQGHFYTFSSYIPLLVYILLTNNFYYNK